MFYLIYRITNKLNTKTYVGAHKTENKDDGYMGSGKLIQQAIKKYGKENFEKEILIECTSMEEMYDKEREMVELGPMSYNMKVGGIGCPYFYDSELHRQRLSEKAKLRCQQPEVKNFMAELSKKNWENPELQKIMSKTFSGKHHTPEYVEEMRQRGKLNIGEKNPMYNRCWIHKDAVYKTIKKDEIQSWINQGWIKGGKTAAKGTCYIHNINLKENKMIKKDEIQSWIDQGWIKGRKLKW